MEDCSRKHFNAFPADSLAFISSYQLHHASQSQCESFYGKSVSCPDQEENRWTAPAPAATEERHSPADCVFQVDQQPFKVRSSSSLSEDMILNLPEMNSRSLHNRATGQMLHQDASALV